MRRWSRVMYPHLGQSMTFRGASESFPPWFCHMHIVSNARVYVFCQRVHPSCVCDALNHNVATRQGSHRGVYSSRVTAVAATSRPTSDHGCVIIATRCCERCGISFQIVRHALRASPAMVPLCTSSFSLPPTCADNKYNT